MSEPPKLCVFCNEPTVRESVAMAFARPWGGSAISRSAEQDVCRNTSCDSYGDHVATK